MRVLKFGGKSLSTIEKIDKIAQTLSQQIKDSKDTNIIVVVSAMGNTTTDLTKLSSRVEPQNPSASTYRELDMLLASGERVSAALLSLALQKHNVPSMSFTGSQAGILTEGKHSDSFIKEIKPQRIDDCLSQKIVPVIAGFQGVDPVTKDVTTLGRGGSDLTACALAHHYNCTAELYKTVGGVHSCDPNIIPHSTLIKELDYHFLQDLSSWGGKILHDKAADFIFKNKTPICFLSDRGFNPLTYVNSKSSSQGFAISCLDHIVAVKVATKKIPEALEFLNSEFGTLHFRVLASAYNNEDSRFLIETEEHQKSIFLNSPKLEILDDELVAVSAIFNSSKDSSFLNAVTSKVSQFEIKRLLETQKRLSFFINQSEKKNLIEKLYSILTPQ